MPVIPANCLTRKELHGLINRSDELHRSSSGDKVLADAFRDLLVAAANLDGVLADKSEGAGEHPNHKQVFDDVWPSKWMGSKVALHTARGLFCIGLEQQILTRPSDNSYIGTGRYRLALGEEIHHGPPAHLRLLAERYLKKFDDVIPATVADTAIERFFAQEDKDAVREQCPAT